MCAFLSRAVGHRPSAHAAAARAFRATSIAPQVPLRRYNDGHPAADRWKPGVVGETRELALLQCSSVQCDQWMEMECGTFAEYHHRVRSLRLRSIRPKSDIRRLLWERGTTVRNFVYTKYNLRT